MTDRDSAGRVVARSEAYARWDAVTADLEPPFAIIDLSALAANADDLVRRAAGTSIRLASKSIRVRRIIEDVMPRPGFAGVMAYSLPEAIWLAGHGVRDILVGYPTVDRKALATLRSRPDLAETITLMVDDPAHLSLIEDATGGFGSGPATIRLCMDIDTSYRPLGAVIGARRSPIRTPEQAVSFAREVQRHKGFRLAGVMTYEAQIAGVPDTGPAIRLVKRRSIGDIERRRAAIVGAVESVTRLEFVNAGGTGSVELSASGPRVTEVTAGSGLLGPTLFDRYDAFRPRPAAAFALPVVRRPAPGVATVFAGGWIASGPPGPSRAPTPIHPAGLRLSRTEGAGEVQTPVLGASADGLRIGDRVWFRHAKSGELFEHVDRAYLIDGDTIATAVPTYRGESQAYG